MGTRTVGLVSYFDAGFFPWQNIAMMLERTDDHDRTLSDVFNIELKRVYQRVNGAR